MNAWLNWHNAGKCSAKRSLRKKKQHTMHDQADCPLMHCKDQTPRVPWSRRWAYRLILARSPEARTSFNSFHLFTHSLIRASQVLAKRLYIKVNDNGTGMRITIVITMVMQIAELVYWHISVLSRSDKLQINCSPRKARGSVRHKVTKVELNLLCTFNACGRNN